MSKLLSALAVVFFAASLVPGIAAADNNPDFKVYKQARKQADVNYKRARTECRKKSGDEAVACLQDAQAAKRKAIADAKAARRGALAANVEQTSK